MKNKLQLIGFIIIIFKSVSINSQVAAQNKNANQKLKGIENQCFIENKGQWPNEVLYLTQMGGLNTWITTKGMLYEFYKTEETRDISHSSSVFNETEDIKSRRWGHRVYYKLLNNNVIVNPKGNLKLANYNNYLIGNDASKFETKVGLYQEIIVKDVYEGIDMRYYFENSLLRYDYIVHPGANPIQIRFRLEGSNNSYLNDQGELVFTTSLGEVKNAGLLSYQKDDRKTVRTNFKYENQSWTIALGNYDKNQTLIIDPLIYSTYIGGAGGHRGESIAIDSAGCAYITGVATYSGYDTTVGAFQTTYSGGNDAFVSKINAEGTALLYSTYLGGTGPEQVRGITIDTAGNAYIAGATQSANFPTTPGAFQTSVSNTYDIFVSKISSDGTALIYSTYIGGSGIDLAAAIVIDPAGNAYITGHSNSTDYDVTAGAYQTFLNGSVGYFDAIVTKLNTTGSALILSTYIGGTSSDVGSAIAIDNSENIYITGSTNGNYPTSGGAFRTIYNGGQNDAFVTKFNATGSALLYSTYLGGNLSDGGSSIKVDQMGNAYVSGGTESANFDVTEGVYQTNLVGLYSAFVSKLNAAGSSLIYSTYIAEADRAFLEIEASGNVFISGYTQAVNFPTTSNAFQTNHGGGTYDAYLMKLNVMGTALIYSTLIGGAVYEFCTDIAVDNSGNVYIIGGTASSNYPVTDGSFQTSLQGSENVFITKFGIIPPLSTEQFEVNKWLTIYPNPSSGIYQIEIKNSDLTDALIEIYDVQGRMIAVRKIDSKTIKLDISSEPAGIYILKIKKDDIHEISRLVKF